MSHQQLRSAGDFKNKATVEYATVLVEIPSRLAPANMHNPHYEGDDIVKGLYASPTGRLTFQALYLDSVELAEKFATYLTRLFKNRPYRKDFAIKVEVITTTQTVTATKGKLKHSALVKQILFTDL
jgi:hypothetical protein